MEKTKKQYIRPEITVVEVEPEHILAGSTIEFDRSSIEDEGYSDFFD